MKSFHLAKHLLFGMIFLISSHLSYAKAPVSNAANDEITGRLARIEQLLQSQGLLDMLQQLDSLQQEIRKLRGEIEQQNHSLDQLRKRQRALYNDVDQRMQRFEGRGSAFAPSPAETGPANPPLQTLAPVTGLRDTTVSQHADSSLTIETVTTPHVQQSVRPATKRPHTMVNPNTVTGVETMDAYDPALARTEYQNAFNLLKQSRHDQAIKAFREFLAANPLSEYSDNAQYWLGEAYYVMRQFESALVEYEKLTTTYPDSQKVTHSLLKIGYSYHELGQIDEAKRHLQDLKQRYPGTTAARLAQDRLKTINALQQQPTVSN